MTDRFAGALGSNLGDHYHLMYAVRRMINMLHPRSNLHLLALEGVSSEDVSIVGQSKSVRAADVTEYYGGTNFHSANHIVITQLKYSFAYATQNWTLRRLCRLKTLKDPTSSVLGGLASLFSYYASAPNFQANKLTIQIYTNQPLQPKLSRQLNQVVQHLSGKPSSEISIALSQLTGDLKTVVDEIKNASQLDWEQLGQFLMCWNRDSFSQPNLAITEQTTVGEMRQYLDADTTDYINRLIVYALKTAEAGERHEIHTLDVLRQLEFSPSDFFPAPYQPEPINHYQLTQTQQDLDTAIKDRHSGFIVLHGSGGQGKSTELQYFARSSRNSQEVIVYDCWDGGTARTPGLERYQLETFLTQVINELDTLYQTNILANRRDLRSGDQYQSLLQRFVKALDLAANTAFQQGNRLVIVVDAADEAVKAYQKRSLQRATSSCFLPTLCDVPLPDNCVIVISTRTENIDKLDLPREVEYLKVTGFDLEQTQAYIHSHIPELRLDLVRKIHTLSEGTPRIIDFAVQRLLIESPEDADEFISHIVKSPLEEAYRQACADINNGGVPVEKALATLKELRNPEISVLADIFELSLNECQAFLNKLYFGIRVLDNGELQFKNKNFEDFVDLLAESYRQSVVAHIADFCASAINKSDYAFRNFVYYAFHAQRFQELIDRQLDGHLEARITQLAPYREDILEEMQYSLIAATTLGKIDSAISFLVTAAEIAHGSDVFAEQLKTHADLAVKFDYHHRLIKYLKKTSSDESLIDPYWTVIRYLAFDRKEPGLIQALLQEGFRIVREHENRFGQGFRWDMDAIRNSILYHCYSNSLRDGLEELQHHWSPQKSLLYLYTEVLEEYEPRSQSLREIWETIESADLGDHQKLFAKIGLVLRGDLSHLVENPSQLVQDLADVIRTERLTFSNHSSPFLSRVVLKFLQNGVSPVDLTPLLDLWKPPSPSVNDIHHFPGSDLTHFLKWVVLQELSGAGNISLNEYTPPNDQKQGGLSDLRLVLQMLYPACRAHITALTKADTNSIIPIVTAGINAWRDPKLYLPSKAHYYRAYVSECIEAIVALPNAHLDTVEELLASTEELLTDSYKGWPDIAEILSHNPLYHSIAERLIYKQAEVLMSERMPAGERVESLLSLCHLLLSMGMNAPALDMFNYARKYAEQWDYRAFGRSKALVNVTQTLQQRGGDLTRNQVFDLLNVFDYINSVSSDDRGTQYPHILQIVSRNHLDVALESLRIADNKKHIQFGQGVIAVANGLLYQPTHPPQSLWPLIHLSGEYEWDTFAAEAARRMQSTLPDHNLSNLLDRWAIKIRRNLEIKSTLERTTRYLEWAAASQVQHPQLEIMQNFRVFLQTIEDRSHTANYARTTHSQELSGLGAKEDSGSTFDGLIGLIHDELQELSPLDLSRRVSEVLTRLTKSQSIDLASAILNRQWKYQYDSILRILIDIAEHVGTSAYTSSLHMTIQQLTRQFLEAKLPSLLYYYQYQTEQTTRFSRSSCIDDETFFSALLSGAATHLNDLTSDQMYLIISYVGERFSVEQASSALNALLNQALNAIDKPELTFTNPSSVQEAELLIGFLCEYLGDPRQSLCWEITHALIDSAIEAPDIVLPILLKEAKSERHVRWISIREWILFIVYYLAMHSPRILQNYIDDITYHALNSNFPHVRIREHACQALLLIERCCPGNLTQEIAHQVSQINKPIKRLVKSDRQEPIDSYSDIELVQVSTSQNKRRSAKKNYFEMERYKVFDLLDTVGYWFEPLGERFEISTDDIMELAAVWVVDKWGISNEQCIQDFRRLRHRFGEKQLPFRHQGHLPSIVDLRTYAEYHATQLVAGQLIDTRAVYTDEADHWRTWESWLHSNVYTADPAVTSRLLDAPPSQAENYGVFRKEYKEWASKADDGEFSQQLWMGEESDWIVVAMQQHGKFSERKFSIIIESALAPVSTSFALARALEVEPLYRVNLPALELPYDLVGIESIEEYLSMKTLETSFYDEDFEDIDGRFQVDSMIVEWRSEKSISDYDPMWHDTGRQFLLPSPDFVKQMRLSRKPLTLNYFDDSNQEAVRWEGWHQSAGYAERNSITGNRLIIRRDLIEAYLRSKNLNLILEVRISRERPYDYHDKSEEYDPGKRKTYVLTDNGELISC